MPESYQTPKDSTSMLLAQGFKTGEVLNQTFPQFGKGGKAEETPARMGDHQASRIGHV